MRNTVVFILVRGFGAGVCLWSLLPTGRGPVAVREQLSIAGWVFYLFMMVFFRGLQFCYLHANLGLVQC